MRSISLIPIPLVVRAAVPKQMPEAVPGAVGVTGWEGVAAGGGGFGA